MASLSDQLESWVVIPASGIGTRMGGDRPKQYLELRGRSILERTLDNLLAHPRITAAVVVLNAEDLYWTQINYQHEKPVHTVLGGAERYLSVLNGLNYLQQLDTDNPLVLIHDAVRPFVSHQDLDQLITIASDCADGALLATPVADTLKLGDHQQRVKKTQDRSKLWRAYTPQAFYLDRILEALNYAIEAGLEVTDDASAMEARGWHPTLVECDSGNIKITHPSDLLLAELMVAAGQREGN